MSKMAKRCKDAEIYWAITGTYGLYLGTWFLRKDAIAAHSESLGKSWEKCYRNGDRAIRVRVIPQKFWRPK